jgi:type IV secretion system protein VirB10
MADNQDDETFEGSSDNATSGEAGYEGYEYQPEELNPNSQAGLDQGPSVATPKGKAVVGLAIGVILVLFIAYQLLFSGGGDEIVVEEQQPEVTQTASIAAAIPIPNDIPITIPPPPEPEPEPSLESLPLPPPMELPPPDPNIDFAGAAPTNQELQKRRSSTMLLASGKGVPLEERTTYSLGLDTANKNALFAQTATKNAADKITAGHVGNLSFLVLEGKIIHAILETAIDSSLPGPLRAVVSRDVYAEAGKNILIPKGSRLLGTYNTDINRGQGRVFIVWSRIIRPDGVDIKIASTAVDRLGRAGLTAFVDERYFEIFSGALLTSAFTIGMGAVGDAMTDSESVTTTTNTDGSSTTSGTASATAVSDAIGNFSDVTTNILSGLLDMRPQLTVDQGTPVKVFVNQDLEFPYAMGNQINFIQ